MIVTVKGEKFKLPDFLIVGAAKSGTSALYYYLIQHFQIFMPKLKEPQFFSFMKRSPHYRDSNLRGNKTTIRRFEDYIKLFETLKDEQIIGEASTIYLNTHKITTENIKSVYGEKYKNLKIIAILRNPIDRAFSHYLFNIKMGMETLSFKEAINPQVIADKVIKQRRHFFDYIGYGMYYNQIKAYREEFPYVKIYLFEDLKNPKNLLRDLFEFLGINPNIEINTDIRVNPSGIPKSRILADLLLNIRTLNNSIKLILSQKYRLKLVHFRDKLLNKLLEKPEIDTVIREKLIKIYREDILELQELINRDLSHWLEVKS